MKRIAGKGVICEVNCHCLVNVYCCSRRDIDAFQDDNFIALASCRNGLFQRIKLIFAYLGHSLTIRHGGGGEEGGDHQDGEEQRQDGLFHLSFLLIFFCFQSSVMRQAEPVSMARGTPCTIPCIIASTSWYFKQVCITI